MDRRDFLKGLAAATPALMVGCQDKVTNDGDRLGFVLPKRLLKRSGEQVTMLGLGGYHVGWTTERDAQETIEAALAGGIRFFDTAESYGDGLSETRYGKYLTPQYRDLIFLMTKTTASTAAEAEQHLEGSLRRLNTDHLDLWQVHSLGNPDDVDGRITEGVLDVFTRAKESGKVRHIGFTGHRQPAAHLRMLERTSDQEIFETCQMPVNVLDPSRMSFIRGVLPVLEKRNISLLAMKTLADGRFFPVKVKLGETQWESDDPVVPNRISIEEALNFAWSLPISVLITGAENAKLVEEKIQMAKAHVKLSEDERNALIDKVADLSANEGIEYFKQADA